MFFSRYADLLRLPGVLRLVLVALVARLPHAMTGIVLTLHVVTTLDKGYGQAGIVAGAMTLGSAIGAPWRGRMVDTLGLRRALAPSVAVEAAVWICAPLLGYELLIGAAFVAGLFLVPVFSVVRQSLGVLVPPAQQRTGYALDSVGTEATFMLAPVTGVMIATQVSTTVALVVVGVATVGAGVLLMWLDPPTRSVQLDGTAAPDPVERGSWRDLVTPGLLVILAASVAASLVLNGTDLAIVASLQDSGRGGSVGWMVALWAGGSLIGGLVYGAGRHAVHPLGLVFALAVLTVPAAFAGTPLLLAFAVVLAGLPCAPALSSITATLVRLVPEHRRGEVMGWNGTAMTVGAALGAPVCGAVIDRAGAPAGFLTASLVAAGLAGAGLVVLKATRDRAVEAAARDEAEPAPGDALAEVVIRAAGSGGALTDGVPAQGAGPRDGATDDGAVVRQGTVPEVS